MLDRPRPQALYLRITVACLCVTGAGALGCGGSAGGSKTTLTLASSSSIPSDTSVGSVSVRPARLKALPAGWAQTTGGSALLTPRGASTTTSITSWRYAPNSSGPVAGMPRSGFVIDVFLSRRAGRSLCSRPPRLAGYPAEPIGRFSLAEARRAPVEGFPERSSLLFKGRRANDYNYEIRVIFGARHPARSLRLRAVSATNRIFFPHWPHACS